MASPYPRPEAELIEDGIAWVREHQRYPHSKELGGASGLPGETAVRHRYRSLLNYHRAIWQADQTLPLPVGARRGGQRLSGTERKTRIARPRRQAHVEQVHLGDAGRYDLAPDDWLGPPQRMPQGKGRVGTLRFGERPTARPAGRVLVQIRRW